MAASRTAVLRPALPSLRLAARRADRSASPLLVLGSAVMLFCLSIASAATRYAAGAGALIGVLSSPVVPITIPFSMTSVRARATAPWSSPSSLSVAFPIDDSFHPCHELLHPLNENGQCVDEHDEGVDDREDRQHLRDGGTPHGEPREAHRGCCFDCFGERVFHVVP